jgi:FKBP-type peptidyl-prolyl cis-trans isomerase
LDQAKEEEGATTTKGGVVIVPITKGSGMYPTSASSVEVHYTGMLADGTGKIAVYVV